MPSALVPLVWLEQALNAGCLGIVCGAKHVAPLALLPRSKLEPNLIKAALNSILSRCCLQGCFQGCQAPAADAGARSIVLTLVDVAPRHGASLNIRRLFVLAHH